MTEETPETFYRASLPEVLISLDKIRREVKDYVRKEKDVPGFGGGYKVVTHDQITAHVRPLFVQHQVLILPGILITDKGPAAEYRTDVIKTKDGADRLVRHFSGLYQFRFVSTIDGSEESVVVPADGDDSGDKGPNKATSMAQKNAILKVLMLETGENEEGRNAHEHMVAAMIEHVTEQLDNMIEHGDSLGVYLLANRIQKEGNEQIWDAAYRAAPAGKLTDRKKMIKDLEKQGFQILREIHDGFVNDDFVKVLENASDITEDTRKLFYEKIGPERVQTFKRWVKEASQ